MTVAGLNFGNGSWLCTSLILVVRVSLSVQFAKQIGVTQKTAWFMAQRIRESYISNRNKLAGNVELDETYVGGKERNKHENKKIPWSQGGANKTIIAGAMQRDSYGNKKTIKAQVVENTRVKTLKEFIHNNTRPEAVLISDEHKSYDKLSDYKVNHSRGQYVGRRFIHTNNIENFWSIFKRGYIGVYHYMSKKHLQRYVNEYSHRFNYRESKFSPMFSNINKVLRYKELIRG